MRRLSDLVQYLDEKTARGLEPRERLEECLQRLGVNASEMMTRLSLTESELVDVIVHRLQNGSDEPDPIAQLSTFHVSDALLAFACTRGDQTAITTFIGSFGSDLDVAIGKSPNILIAKDEFRQIFLTHILVPNGGEHTRLSTYSGKGPLRAWVRVSATRLIIDLARAHKPADPTTDETLLALLPSTGDPELEFLRRQYAPLLPSAFEKALEALSPRQRNLLRERYLRGLSAEKLALMYSVHRATASAWIEQARKELLIGVRRALLATLPSHNLDSIISLLGSALHVSVGRLLAQDREDE